MKRPEWDALSTRERDAVVDEKVMGRSIPSVDDCMEEAVRVWKNQPGCTRFYRGFLAHMEPDGTPIFDGYNIKPYTTSWDAMREVVEKATGRGWSVQMGINDDGSAFAHLFSAPGPDGECFSVGYGAAPMLPEAVCIAALVALGHMEEG